MKNRSTASLLAAIAARPKSYLALLGDNHRWAWEMTCLVCICCIMAPRAAGAETQYTQSPGPYPVKTILLDWKDAQRDRSVPVKIYYPDTPQGKFPVVIFSHGAGGSRDGYTYLGEYWAGFGYVCVHVQHLGSDNAIWQGLPANQIISAMRKSVALPENILNRPLDVSFTIDQLEKLNQDDPLFKGRLDLDRIGVAGHSFGAYTALAIAGEVFITSRGTTLARPDPRVKAAIAMSESAPREAQQYDPAFAKIAIPMMHMTGTLDESPVGDAKAADRRVPFDHIPPTADQYLVIFQGGDHMVFSGRIQTIGPMAGTGNPALDPTFQVMIQQSTTAFWDAYLKSDEKAKKWLADGPCKTMLGQNATLEIKAAKEH
jgi:predicted dienelactone hydrolase